MHFFSRSRRSLKCLHLRQSGGVWEEPRSRESREKINLAYLKLYTRKWIMNLTSQKSRKIERNKTEIFNQSRETILNNWNKWKKIERLDSTNKIGQNEDENWSMEARWSMLALFKISNLRVWYSIFEVHFKTQSESCKKSSQAIWKMDDIQCSFAASLTLSASLKEDSHAAMQIFRFLPFWQEESSLPPSYSTSLYFQEEP